MKKCTECGIEFKIWQEIDGKLRNLKNRKRCLSCHPFKVKLESSHKICSMCKLLLPKESYLRDGNCVQSKCKKCHNKYYIERWIKRKIKAIEYKGGKCNDCDFKSDHYSIYDFHHNGKDADWGVLKKRSWDKITKELDGCVLLCSNCHRIRHCVRIAIGSDTKE